MAMCTSRRACADRNSFRLYMEKDGKVLDGKYIWTEHRCPNVASLLNGKACVECAVKLPKHKYQANPKCDHGFVDGPYPSDSKLYGSPFYLKEIKEGWKIREADETRAKEAQITASSTMPKKVAKSNEDVIQQEEPVAVAPVKKPKQPRKVKLKKNSNDVELTTQAAPAPAIAVDSPTNLGPAKFLEAMTAPIKIEDVIVVKVRKITCDGKEYYFDSLSGKAYAATAAGVGAYKGRYDPETEKLITGFPDSDVE